MKCKSIEQLLPLYIEGDLPPRKTRRASDHLRDCPACRAKASEYRDSQAWLHAQGPLDLDESVFDDLRGQVLRRIHAHPAQGGVRSLRLILAVAVTLCVIAAGLVVYLSQRGPRSVQETPAELVQNPAMPALREPEKVEHAPGSKGGAEKRQPPHAARRGARVEPPAAAARLATEENGGKVDIEALPDPAAVPQWPLMSSGADTRTDEEDQAETDTLRIEIQTSDPNIRIIWFARYSAKPALETE